jgi:cytochrome c peroxidase
LFWDGRRTRLDKAVLDPFLHPVELGLVNQADLVERLQKPNYRQAFAKAFGDAPTSASSTLTETGTALKAFIRSLPRPEVPYDLYRSGRDPHALSPQALEGLRLFTGKARCSQCHGLGDTPSRFTDDGFHPTGTGLLNVAAHLSRLLRHVATQPINVAMLGREVGTNADLSALGRFMVTHQAKDIGLFRTPSLRYVVNTAPYMHDGSVPTLDEAVDQEAYWRGLTQGRPLSLTVSERADLIAFLRALSITPAVPANTEVRGQASQGATGDRNLR